MRHPSNFKRTDVTRAAKGLREAGLDIASLEIEPVTGKITFMTIGGSGAEKITDLDKWMGDHASQT
jgi:hypothetical protein